MSNPSFPMSAEDIAGQIGIPLQAWPGNCHAIATAILNTFPMQGLRLVRGHYTGYVSPKSVFRRGAPQQHSWLRLGDGRILDPTRWVFTAPERRRSMSARTLNMMKRASAWIRNGVRS